MATTGEKRKTIGAAEFVRAYMTAENMDQLTQQLAGDVTNVPEPSACDLFRRDRRGHKSSFRV